MYQKKIGLNLYLLLYFNFLTRKPIQIALITYLWLKMKTSQPKIISFVNSFFEMVKKFYDASNVHFLAFFPWFSWSLFNVSLHLRLNLINLGKLQCSFDVGEAATPPCTWQGFQMLHLYGLKNGVCQFFSLLLWRLRSLIKEFYSYGLNK